MVEEYGGVVRFAGPSSSLGINAFLASEKALQELSFNPQLGKDNGHLGAGRRGGSDYGVERKRAVHLLKLRLGHRRRLCGRY